MAQKPTYEELEQRINELEAEANHRKQAEEELRESEERYRSLLYRIQAAVVVHNSDTQIIASNPKAQDLLGLTEDQMLGKAAIDPDWKFLNADGERMSLKEYPVNQVLANRQPLRDLTAGIYYPNKVEQVWVLVNADPVFDYKGNIQQVVVTFMDITERKKMEETLRESEERFRYLTESSPLGVFQTDKDGSVLYLNNTWLAITGMSLQDALGFGWAQALHPEDRPRILAEWARCLEEKRGYDGEFRFVRPSGETHWVHTRTSPVFSSAGDIISHVGVNEDITDRKQAEEALRQYEHIVSSSTDMLALLDKRFNYLAANEAYIEAFKLTPEQLIGNTVADVFGKEFFNTVIKPHGDRCLGGEEINYQNWFDFPAHARRYMDVTYYPYYGEDNMIMGFVVNGRNITKRKQVEEEREKLISELQEASKEIKTLRGILPLCSFCKKIRDDKGYWEQVDVYIHQHTDADVSHGICPECAKEHYPDLDIYDD